MVCGPPTLPAYLRFCADRRRWRSRTAGKGSAALTPAGAIRLPRGVDPQPIAGGRTLTDILEKSELDALVAAPAPLASAAARLVSRAPSPRLFRRRGSLVLKDADLPDHAPRASTVLPRGQYTLHGGTGADRPSINIAAVGRCRIRAPARLDGPGATASAKTAASSKPSPAVRMSTAADDGPRQDPACAVIALIGYAPQPDRIVHAAGGERPPIRRVCQADDPTRVSGQGEELLIARRVP
jgi:hypothetical protein